MSIYTKKGDKGKTSLYKGHLGKTVKVSKSSCNTHALGCVDEVNSYLGIVALKIKKQRSKIKDTIQISKIKRIQKNLFSIGSTLAGAKTSLKSLDTRKLEKEIDKMEEELPKLANFLIPGGSEISVNLMYARALVRRAERAAVALNEKEKISPSILRYLNRLSDYLFTLARYQNHKTGVVEDVWKK